MSSGKGARLATVLVVAGLLGASCGLSPEKRPHEISDRAILNLLPPTSSSASSPDGIQKRSVLLYFFRGERLKKLYVRAGGDSLTRERVLTLLLGGTPRDADKGWTTSIPPGTSVRGTRLRGSTLRIDLSGEIKSLGGTAAKAAYAQLVFTALQFRGVRSVRFAIEGDNIDAITDDGNLTIIQAKNYRPPLKPT